MLPRSHLGMCEAQNHVLEVVRVAEMPALHDKEWMENQNESKSRSRSEGTSASCKEWYDSGHKHGAGVIGGSCCDCLCMWSSMTTQLICDEVSIVNTIKIICMGWLMLRSISSSLECKHQWRCEQCDGCTYDSSSPDLQLPIVKSNMVSICGDIAVTSIAVFTLVLCTWSFLLQLQDYCTMELY